MRPKPISFISPSLFSHLNFSPSIFFSPCGSCLNDDFDGDVRQTESSAQCWQWWFAPCTMHAEVERRCCGAAAAVQAAQVQSLALFCFYDREIACIGIESSRFFFFFLNGLCGPKPVAQRGKQEARNTKANFVGAHLCFFCPPSKQRHREASRQKLPFFKISIKTERKRGQRRQCEIVFPFLDSFGRRNEPK